MANKRPELPVREMLRESTGSMLSEADRRDTDDRLNQIAKTEYLCATSREFKRGDPVDDWLQIELALDSLLKRFLAH